MSYILEGVRRTSKVLHGVGGVSLVVLMLLTTADVVGRAFGRPVKGTFELVGFTGALAIGLALPFTSWVGGHVHVDSLISRLPETGQKVLQAVTRLLGMGLFGLLGWHLIRFGLDLRASGEVSPTLELHFYPVAFGLAAACFLQVIVLAASYLAAILRSDHD
jgi:TRAP-type C4-dicarboxylate transport system permease small subunit